jgi:hypothetical protein
LLLNPSFPVDPFWVYPERLDPALVEQTMTKRERQNGLPFKGLKEFSVLMERTV